MSDGAGQPIAPGITLRPPAQGRWQAHAAPDAPAVLGEEPSSSALTQFTLFEAASPAIELTVVNEPTAVLGGEEAASAELSYVPTEQAAYVLLQTVETPEGTVFDITLPHPQDAPTVLGAEPEALSFPINPLPPLQSPSQTDGPAVLGIEDLIGGVITDVIGKRILRIIKTPIDRALLTGIAAAEAEPKVLALQADAAEPFRPLASAEEWRSLLPPGAERRVLLFIHGFGSSTQGSSGAQFLPELTAGYDAVLSYDHPTVARDPLQNALDLLEMIPEDLRLSVDLVAHSRGGLVARSLVELVEPVERFVPRVLVTHGSPHAGTELANPARWDRLVSITMTSLSWLAALTGIAAPLPKIVEWVLKAAAQSVFSLPGIAAMSPVGTGQSDFLTQLNAAADPATLAGALQGRVRYATVTSRFSVFGIENPTFRQALAAMASQAFINQPHDLVVPTASMSAIDAASAQAAEQTFLSHVNHFSYFTDPKVLAFLRSQLNA